MGGLEWWHWVIIALAAFLLFGGYRRLPSATKSLAQSMKIFKDETRGLVGDHDADKKDEAVAPAAALPAPAAVDPQPVAVLQPVPVATQQPTPVTVPAPQPAAVTPPTPAVAPQQVPPAPAPPAPDGGSLAPRPGAYASGGQNPR